MITTFKLEPSRHTSTSITTIAIVLIIALIILLIGNYTKNSNSGIALSYQPLNIITNVQNPSAQDKVAVIASAKEFNDFTKVKTPDINFNQNLILGIIAIGQPSNGYSLVTNKIFLRDNQINIDYAIKPPTKGQLLLTVVTYPTLLLQLDRANLPLGVLLNFRFNNLINHTDQTINFSLKI